MAIHMEIATTETRSERAPLAKPGDLVVASPRSCAVCGAVLTGRPQQKCCSARCRAAKSRRQRVPLPRDTERDIRAKLAAALEAVFEAKATLERYGG